MRQFLKEEEILEKYGWSIDCESPYELSHEDGSFASGAAAHYVKNAILEEFINDQYEDLEEQWKEFRNKKSLVKTFLSDD